MMNIKNAWAQPDGFNYETIILKHKTVNKAFIICKGERVAVITNDNCRKRCPLTGIADSFIMIKDAIIPIADINKIKYLDGQIKEMKQKAIVVAPIILASGITSFLLLLNNINTGSDMIDIIFIMLGYTVIAYYTSVTEFVVLQVLAFPYKSFNLKTRWQVVSNLK